MKFFPLVLASIGAVWAAAIDGVLFDTTLVSGSLQDFTVGSFSLLDLHKQLVSTSSVSYNETAVAYLLADYLREAGLTVELQELDDSNRYNVYAYFGSARDTDVVLTSHIDTVPPFIPYSVKGTQIFGRGSSDAKASVAAQVFALLSLKEQGLVHPGDVSLLYVVGEEVDGSGALYASEHLGAKWSTAIFGEPTENKLGVGHKGVYGVKLTAHGRASHSGYPQLGISASELLLPVLNKLLQLKFPEDPLLGPSTLNIGKVDIGVAANVVPKDGEAIVFVRVATALEEVDLLVREALDNISPLIEVQYTHGIGPVYLDHKVPGFDTIALAYGTDVPNFKVPLHKRYLYGPGSILVAHGDNENIENESLLEAVQGYQDLVKFVLSSQ